MIRCWALVPRADAACLPTGRDAFSTSGGRMLVSDLAKLEYNSLNKQKPLVAVSPTASPFFCQSLTGLSYYYSSWFLFHLFSVAAVRDCRKFG